MQYGRDLNVMAKYLLVYVISFRELGFSKVCNKRWKMDNDSRPAGWSKTIAAYSQ